MTLETYDFHPPAALGTHQRIEHLKIALRPGQQILAGSFGESTHPVVAALVADIAFLRLPAEASALGGDIDPLRLAKGTAQKTLDQALDPFGILRFQKWIKSP